MASAIPTGTTAGTVVEGKGLRAFTLLVVVASLGVATALPAVGLFDHPGTLAALLVLAAVAGSRTVQRG
ncbi:MAG: hypothetical protein OEV00_00110 [Acidobacteriota bacterium]|nr:hypothetical protein [Acidobacteriota bacterium]MDH3783706.1 hypothetical protein [Acidobacteriota bacterium]